MKKLLFLLLILGLSVISGCHNDDNGKRQVELTYASWGNEQLEQAMLSAFEEAHPNIRVHRDLSITGTGNAFTENLIKVS